MHVRRACACDNALRVFTVYQGACAAHCNWWQAKTHSDATAADGAWPTANRRALATTCPKGTVQGRRPRGTALSGAPACRRRRRRRRRPSSACRGRRRRRRRRSHFVDPPCAARVPARTSASRLGFVAGTQHTRRSALQASACMLTCLRLNTAQKRNQVFHLGTRAGSAHTRPRVRRKPPHSALSTQAR